jgi:hypothetical protein
VRRRNMPVTVLNAVQELDEQIALARRVAQQRANLDHGLRVEPAPLWVATDAAFAAQCRRINDRYVAHAPSPAVCVRSRLFTIMASVEEIAVFIDMRSEVQRVLAYQALCQLRIAPFQRLDDRHVIDDRARRAVFL